MDALQAWQEENFFKKFRVGTLVLTDLENLYLVVSQDNGIYDFKHINGGKLTYHIGEKQVLEMYRHNAIFYFP